MTRPEDLTPQERFDRYVMLQRQIATLERQLNTLKSLIKDDLQQGVVLQSDTHFAHLKGSQSVSYDLHQFQAVFGTELLLRCVSIDKKKVDQLSESGELDELRLLPLRVVTPRTPALVIKAREDSGSSLEPDAQRA